MKTGASATLKMDFVTSSPWMSFEAVSARWNSSPVKVVMVVAAKMRMAKSRMMTRVMRIVPLCFVSLRFFIVLIISLLMALANKSLKMDFVICLC